jgi:hypothetical protein
VKAHTKAAVFVPHTAGRYQKRRFRKALCPIVERCVRLGRASVLATVLVTAAGSHPQQTCPA